MSEYIGFKAGREIEWLELNLLKNKTSLSKSTICSLSGEDETIVDEWISILESRINLYKQPIYSILNNRITPNYSWDEIPEYFLCLYYSFNGANDYSGGTGLFEKISAQALKNFLNGEVFILGFPAGKSFNNYLDDIGSVCFEDRILPAHYSYKDDGVDVVGYKSFNDKRSSNLYVLLQCAAGRHWTAKKAIVMNRWLKYFKWYSDNLIQSISTVDFVENEKWEKHSSTFGMLIDRLRIYNFIYEKNVDPALRLEVINWCNDKIAEGI
ncbi:hypothetical protein [Flavobacterium sp.]|uniref:hypothetical protein n=1 Tax=Flavobacterium sp. TaxID=239 RepID=UPI002616E8E7|nr:hypothetical protein [Flavobacterium sp.]